MSALATRGLCVDLFQLVVGETVLAELRKNLAKKLQLPAATIDAIETFLRRQGTVVSASVPKARHGLDSADATVLAEAAAAAVDLLVNGGQAFQRRPAPA